MTSSSTIHVQGEARRKVIPDTAYLSARISTNVYEQSSDALMDAVRRRKTLIADFTRDLPDAEVDDSNISVSPNYVSRWIVESQASGGRRDKEEGKWESVHEGFTASCSVRAQMEPAKVARAMALVGTSEANAASGAPSFGLSPELRRSVHLELVAEAVHAAREEAESLAGAAGLALGAVTSIGEKPDEGGRSSSGSMFADDSMEMSVGSMSRSSVEDEIGEVRPRPIEVSANVPVRFCAAVNR